MDFWWKIKLEVLLRGYRDLIWRTLSLLLFEKPNARSPGLSSGLEAEPSTGRCPRGVCRRLCKSLCRASAQGSWNPFYRLHYGLVIPFRFSTGHWCLFSGTSWKTPGHYPFYREPCTSRDTHMKPSALQDEQPFNLPTNSCWHFPGMCQKLPSSLKKRPPHHKIEYLSKGLSSS